MAKKIKENEDIIGLDIDYDLYNLTDLFYVNYKYHNDETVLDSISQIHSHNGRSVSVPRTYSRFATFRKIEAMRLCARPYSADEKIAVHRHNTSLGYLRLLLDYLAVPIKAIFTDSSLLKIQIDKVLYNENLSNKEKEELTLNAANNPNLTSNKEVSDDVTDCFVETLRQTKSFKTGIERLALPIIRDGFTAYLHNDIDRNIEQVDALDLITEPMCEFDPDTWGSFFVIKKLSVTEIKDIIRNYRLFWNKRALRWALKSSEYSRGLINSSHYNYSAYMYADKVCTENFQVRSFAREKSSRLLNLSNLYGSILVVEGYYVNSSGKVDKVIFFPSSDFYNVPVEIRQQRKNTNEITLEDADVLFYRKNVFNKMSEALTVIPFDRQEKILERQRGFGHELANPIETIMRLDCSILNFANLMGTPFTKNRAQGTDAQNLEDNEIAVNGDMVDLGDRDFVQTFFTADINGMLAVRSVLLQHVMSKAFLGGLDGQEILANGRGANLANMRLIRDARIHKHNIESISAGLTELYTKIFLSVLRMTKSEINRDVVVQKLFFEKLTKIFGYDEQLLEFNDSDVNQDTGLPYWITLEAIRNGASHYGAAELVLYSEIKQVFGDSLDQRSLSALNRMGIKSLLGSQDAIDILGDPRLNIVTEKDQIYRATVETSTLIGSVDSGALSFESIPVLEDKDDHVAHLAQVHNPKATEIIKMLQGGELSPEVLAQMSDADLETHNNLILKLGALANHIVLHLGQLERFGSNRPDIGQLKEETNAIVQSAEGLMNSLQLSMRAVKERQMEAQMKLQNLSPENEAERMKQEVEMMKIQAKQQEANAKLALANKIADQKYQQHLDTQVSKARDRQAKIAMNERNAQIQKETAIVSRQNKSTGAS